MDKKRPGRKGGRMDFISIVDDILSPEKPERIPVTPIPKKRGRPTGKVFMGRTIGSFLGIKGVEFVKPSKRESFLSWPEFKEYTRGFKELSLFGKRTGEFIDPGIISAAVGPKKATESQRKLAETYRGFIGEWLNDILGLDKKKKVK